MVLSNIEIQAEIDAQRLVFDPPIERGSDRIASSSLDLLLHEELIILPAKAQQGVVLVPDTLGSEVMDVLAKYGERRLLTEDAPYQLQPHHFIIGKTREYITLPQHLAARIEGKSTLARLGVSVHITAPTVMAGFEGRLYLEINNIGPFPIQLQAGMKIAQLILEHVGLPPTEAYSGNYQRQE